MGVTAQHHRQVTGLFGGGKGMNRKAQVPFYFLCLFFSYATVCKQIRISSLSYIFEHRDDSGFPTFTENLAKGGISLFLSLFILLLTLTLTLLTDVKTDAKLFYEPDIKHSYLLSLESKILINWVNIMLMLAGTHSMNPFNSNNLPFLVDNSLRLFVNFSSFPFLDRLKVLKIKMNSKASKISKFILMFYYYLATINLILIIIVNPSIANPGPTNKELSVAYCNAQGFILMSSMRGNQPIFQTHKLLDFQNFIHMNKPDIVIVNESWINEHISNNEIIEEEFYKMFRYDRSKKDKCKYNKVGGGGILILTKQGLDIETKEVTVKNPDQIPVLSIEVKFKDSSKICISTFYRYDYSKKDLLESAEIYYREICKKYSKIVVIGDINLSSVKDWNNPISTNELHNDYIKLFYELGFQNLINQSTHQDGNILDLLLTNQPGLITNITVTPDLLCPSDHYSIK